VGGWVGASEDLFQHSHFVDVCLCVHVHMRVRTCVCAHVCLHIGVWVCVGVCHTQFVGVEGYHYVCEFTCVCAHVCWHMCVRVRVCVSHSIRGR